MAQIVTWNDIPEPVQNDIQRHRHWFVFQGALFVVVGALAIGLPVVTALALEIVLGTALLVGGLARIVTFGKHASGWSWASSICAVIIGALMLWRPWAGLVALSALVSAFLVFEGITEIFVAFRFKPLFEWGWLFASGIISLLLGIGAFVFFPLLGMVYIGVAVGLSLLFYGVALLMVVREMGRVWAT
jgi:uncharacterized membrane protein HdeD (DUF308 family)